MHHALNTAVLSVAIPTTGGGGVRQEHGCAYHGCAYHGYTYYLPPRWWRCAAGTRLYLPWLCLPWLYLLSTPQVVAVCGKNKAVKKQLEAKSWPGVHVEARGFC